MTSDNSRHRLGLIAVTALSLFGALFARLWFLQVVEGDTAQVQAASQVNRTVVVPAPRGQIFDRNGTPLVRNRQSVVLGIDLQQYQDLDEDEQAKLLKDLVAALNAGDSLSEPVTPAFLSTRLNNDRFNRFRPIPLAEDLTPADEIYFEEQADRFPSVSVDRTTVRDYPYGSLASHVLGYVGPLSDDRWQDLKVDNDPDKPYERSDDIGLAGVESTYEQYLRGTPGQRVYEVDRNNRIVREVESERVAPKPGEDLYLSIDAKVQYKAEEALQARLLLAQETEPTAEGGGVAVLDPGNGQVRALASYPTYNPADLVGGISDATWADLNGWTLDEEGERVEGEDGKPLQGPVKLLNRATQGAYPPASTFKLATSYAALKTNLITPETSIEDPGFLRLCEGNGPGCLKRNSGDAPHGSVNLSKALTVSSDVYYYMIGVNAWDTRGTRGDDALQKSIRELGYGAKTGIDLPGERAGSVPDPASEAALALDLFEQDPGAYDNDIAKAKDAGRWRTGFSADLAIGQKALATPLQTANAYASLANGGTLYEPSVMLKVTRSGQPDAVVVQAEPAVIRTIDYGPARQSLIDGFTGVIQPNGTDNGTANSGFADFPMGALPLAGKTGTAQTGLDALGNEKPDNSLFVAFDLRPGEGDHWVATAMLESAGFGSDAAVPAVKMILQPIADGSLASFEIPAGGAIDAEKVAESSAEISTDGGD